VGGKKRHKRTLGDAYAEAAEFDRKMLDEWIRRDFEILCKRTDYPKLGYIISRLNNLGVRCLLRGRSFHANNILWVCKEDLEVAWRVLREKRVVWYGKTLDEMPDDDPCFHGYANVKPDPLDDWVGDPSRDRAVPGDR